MLVIIGTHNTANGEHFPGVSKRTIQRDLQILKGIGYRIWYDIWEKQYMYDFPSDMMGIF